MDLINILKTKGANGAMVRCLRMDSLLIMPWRGVMALVIGGVHGLALIVKEKEINALIN